MHLQSYEIRVVVGLNPCIRWYMKIINHPMHQFGCSASLCLLSSSPAPLWEVNKACSGWQIALTAECCSVHKSAQTSAKYPSMKEWGRFRGTREREGRWCVLNLSPWRYLSPAFHWFILPNGEKMPQAELFLSRGVTVFVLWQMLLLFHQSFHCHVRPASLENIAESCCQSNAKLNPDCHWSQLEGKRSWVIVLQQVFFTRWMAFIWKSAWIPMTEARSGIFLIILGILILINVIVRL